eukprot:scaffold274_cov384-Prasinococcus_capsulatus_cf.AAC.7
MSAASVLLAVHCKKGEPVELDKALKAYIQQNYSLDPQTADDLKTLQSWRADALRQSAGAVRPDCARSAREACRSRRHD